MIRVAVEVDPVDEAAAGEEDLYVLEVVPAGVLIDVGVSCDDDRVGRNLLELDPCLPHRAGVGTGQGAYTPGVIGSWPLPGDR